MPWKGGNEHIADHMGCDRCARRTKEKFHKKAEVQNATGATFVSNPDGGFQHCVCPDCQRSEQKGQFANCSADVVEEVLRQHWEIYDELGPAAEPPEPPGAAAPSAGHELPAPAPAPAASGSQEPLAIEWSTEGNEEQPPPPDAGSLQPAGAPRDRIGDWRGMAIPTADLPSTYPMGYLCELNRLIANELSRRWTEEHSGT